jgi:hypothetical protein
LSPVLSSFMTKKELSTSPVTVPRDNRKILLGYLQTIEYLQLNKTIEIQPT